MSALEDAAREYVAERLANDEAEPSTWAFHAAQVDNAWHELLAEVERDWLKTLIRETGAK